MHKFLQKLIIGIFLVCFYFLNQAAVSRNEIVKNDIKETLGFVPDFMKALPENTLEGAWTEYKSIMLSSDSVMPAKLKELTALAVASQIPCAYCIYAHKEYARVNGASDVEIGEALGIAAQSRHWSTIFQGMQIDEKQFKAEIKQAFDLSKKASRKQPAVEPIEVKDADSALKDMKQTLGLVPIFFKRIPKAMIPGAWMSMRDVEVNPDSALTAKEKSLIALAVSSQIPCTLCIYGDTEFARMGGAKDEELQEAVAVSSIVRLWSVYLNGIQINEKVYREDIDTIAKNFKTRRDASPTVSR